jgi:DNA-directed RNA polymerase subunit RPC12/RpoP
VVVGALAVQFTVQKNLVGRYDYRCSRCGRAFELSPLAATVAPHRLGGSKLARCSHCGSWSWVERIPKGS